MHRFSIVTPSFNQGSFLRAAVESVRSQEGVALAYRVMDGGSTDDSLEVLRSFGGNLDWRSGPDGGQVRAINAGLAELSGDYCGYLNSDDVLTPGALARVAAIFEQRPEVDVIYGDAWFIDSRGARMRPYPIRPYSAEILIQHCFLCQPATFWRRDVHRRLGWFDPRFDATFDYEFWLRLMVNGAVFSYLPEVLAESREHPSTKTRTQRARIFAEIRRMQLKHLGYCGRNWWEQQLRYWRDESGHWLSRLLPGKEPQRLYRLAWWPYVLWRYRLGGPLYYRPGHWRV